MKNDLLNGVRAMCVLGVVGFACGLGHADEVYVNGSLTTGMNDGTSWENAFRGELALQVALQSVSDGDEVRVAQGVYLPDVAGGDRFSTFLISRSITMKGGYSGDPLNPDERDVVEFETVLSGDLDQDDSNSRIDQGREGGGFERVGVLENVHNVMIVHIGTGVVIDGVTIADGRADLSGNVDQTIGSNVLVLTGDPLFRDCVIRNGYAAHMGGGVAATHSNPSFERVTFKGNRAQQAGGGVAMLEFTNSSFVDCVFEENVGGIGCGLYAGGRHVWNVEPETFVELRGTDFIGNFGLVGASQGGGIQVNKSEVVAIDCEFHGNDVSSGGGAINTNAKRAEFIGCVFSKNVGHADGGGVIYDDGQGVHVGSFDGQPVKLVNCLMYDNNGVGVSVFDGDITFENCTMVNNTVEVELPGWPLLVIEGESRMAIHNSIVWNNDPHDVAFSDREPIDTVAVDGVVNLEVSNSIIELWDGSLPGDAIDVDPMFVDLVGADGVFGSGDEDYRLAAGSPAIDAGENALMSMDDHDLDADGDVEERVPFDLDGMDRVVEHPGVGNGAVVDMGAYEVQVSCEVDLTGDGNLNFFDVSMFLSLFGEGDVRVDFTGEGDLNFLDVSAFLAAFGQGCP